MWEQITATPSPICYGEPMDVLDAPEELRSLRFGFGVTGRGGAGCARGYIKLSDSWS